MSVQGSRVQSPAWQRVYLLQRYSHQTPLFQESHIGKCWKMFCSDLCIVLCKWVCLCVPPDVEKHKRSQIHYEKFIRITFYKLHIQFQIIRIIERKWFQTLKMLRNKIFWNKRFKKSKILGIKFQILVVVKFQKSDDSIRKRRFGIDE